VSLLESNPAPDAAQIAMWMNGNLCRWGTYPRIKDAIRAASDTLASGRRPPTLTARPEPEIVPLSPEELADPVRPYIQIKPDGTVLVFSSQLEMGQGAHTGLATIVAEELDAVRVHSGGQWRQWRNAQRRRLRQSGRRRLPDHRRVDVNASVLGPLPPGGRSGTRTPGRGRV
jgi:hypothetical protein